MTVGRPGTVLEPRPTNGYVVAGGTLLAGAVKDEGSLADDGGEMARVLAVSSDLAVCRQIHAALEGHHVEVALDAVCARMALSDGFDVILVDSGLGAEAVQLVGHVRRLMGDAVRIVALGANGTADPLLEAGANDRGSKPVSAADLGAVVSRSIVSVA
jgi:DNA-binding response OmpR family regulator